MNRLSILQIQSNIYIYRKSASRFSRGTVLNTLKQSRINITRGKKDATIYILYIYIYIYIYMYICMYIYIYIIIELDVLVWSFTRCAML